jgi:hypothetical protein
MKDNVGRRQRRQQSPAFRESRTTRLGRLKHWDLSRRRRVRGPVVGYHHQVSEMTRSPRRTEIRPMRPTLDIGEKLGLRKQLPDDGEMMIVVFRGEEQMIHEPHRLLQPRVQHRAGERVGRQLADAIQ